MQASWLHKARLDTSSVDIEAFQSDASGASTGETPEATEEGEVLLTEEAVPNEVDMLFQAARVSCLSKERSNP